MTICITYKINNKLSCHNNVYLAPNRSYSGICCINLANSNIVIDVIRPLNVKCSEGACALPDYATPCPNYLLNKKKIKFSKYYFLNFVYKFTKCYSCFCVFRQPM